MKIPSKLKVAGQIYKVIQNYKFKERSDLCGHCSHELLVISLSSVDSSGNPLPQSKIEATFLHELLHCIDNQYNGRKLDEEIIDRLSNGLYQVLKDNKLMR